MSDHSVITFDMSSSSSVSGEVVAQSAAAPVARLSSVHSVADELPVSRCGRRVKSRKTEFWGWKHFACIGEKDDRKIMCLACPANAAKHYTLKSGTSTLARHLLKEHGLENKPNVLSDPRQTVFNFDGTLQRRVTEIEPETRATQLEALVDFIVDNKQPFSLVESKSFAAFLRTIDTRYELPSRRTFCRALTDIYGEAFVKLQAVLQGIPGRVALTIDSWSSRVLKGYFATTLHWIDETWQLRCCMRFPSIPSSSQSVDDIRNSVERSH